MLAQKLREQKWTQARISKALGVPRRTVSDWLGEKNSSATIGETAKGCIFDARAKLSAGQKKEIYARTMSSGAEV